MPITMAQQNEPIAFDGIDGFLGFRGSIMLDIVFLAMFAIVPILLWSIYLVKYRQAYELHRKIQLGLGLVLLIAVTAFEIDLQLVTDWELRAAPSPYFDPAAKWTCLVGIILLVHLSCAVPTAVLWIVVITRAIRRFDKPAAPGEHSSSHIRWAKVASIGMLLTAFTGWVFYVTAFVLN